MVARFFEQDNALRFQPCEHKKPGMFARLWGRARSRQWRTGASGCSADVALAQSHLSWEDVCSSVSEEFSLSPRESEVMYLLSIGRNTQRISEILQISPSTTKSHSYRIYQKMQAHTQQEVIDRVEQHACGFAPSDL